MGGAALPVIIEEWLYSRRFEGNGEQNYRQSKCGDFDAKRKTQNLKLRCTR